MKNAMKRNRWMAVLLCLLFLTGCGASYPKQAADGSEWDESWTILGTELGVEAPGNGLTLGENPVVLTGDDTHYVTWTIGDPTSYVNEDGHDTDLYPAELYLLLYGCADETNAQQAVDEWINREKKTYQVSETKQITCNGQDYTLLVYNTQSESNPYSRGVAAFGVHDNYAVSAELSCTAEFEGNEQEILAQFLNGCHYAA